MQTIRDTIAAIIESVRNSAMTRRGLLTGLGMLLLVPVIIWSSNRSMDSMFNAPMRWIPRESEARVEFNKFLDLFGAHELIVVSWAGCDIDDERLGEIATLLEENRERRRESGQRAMINQVLTGNDVLRQLIEPPIRLSRENALRRLQGVVVGADGKTSCVVVELTDYGAAQRREVFDIITDVVTGVTGLAVDDLFLAGSPISGMAIDDESARSIRAYSIPSVVISLVLCWICLRSIWLSIPILLVGVFGQGLMLAMVGWTGNTMNAILIVLPALVFVLSVSAGVHMVNYFIEELGQGTPDEAPQRAMAKARGPCILAAVTTAIGLASLLVSSVDPVHDFGLLGAVGLLICMGLLFLLVPAFMVLWPQLPWIARPHAKQSPVTHPLLSIVSDWVCRHSLAIRVTCLTAMIGMGVGLVWLRTSIDVVAFLSPDNRAVRDFRWFEEHIGPLIPVEVVVHFDQDCTLKTLDRLTVVTLVQKKIAQIELLDGVVSVATFLPPYSRSRNLGGTAVRSVIRKRLEENREDFINAKYLADTPNGEAWRVSARVFAIEKLDHAKFVVQLQQQVDEVLTKLQAAGYEGVSASCTGVEAVSTDVQESLLHDLFNSFVIALLLVAIVMVLALRSVLCGLLAMIPNVFPMLLLFGAMGWNGRTVDIGSVMTASVALGLAVDGTFHFLKWFIHSLKQGESRSDAISVSFQHCGRALMQTTVICASGLLIFSLSGFLPVRHFALMMIMLLMAALVGDLILLPALLGGRLGTVLCRIYQPETVGTEELADSLRPREAI